MKPARGRNRLSLVPCEVPENNAPKPPPPLMALKCAPAAASSNSASNPSLSKALGAAGRQGLLGPAPAAFATTIPPLGAACPAANGAAAQAANSALPLASPSPKKVQKVQEIHKECPALITIVPTVESAESVKPVPKKIWICGNSVIVTAKKRAQSQHHGAHLGIPLTEAIVYWQGIKSMRWEELLPLLHKNYYFHYPPPSVIIIHIGEDELLTGDSTSLYIAMKNDLGIIRRALPKTTIIWSSLLPKFSLEKDQKLEEIEKLQKDINTKMVDQCNKIGVHYMSHILITPDRTNLFLPFPNVLSDAGADLFIADLIKVLKFYGFMRK